MGSKASENEYLHDEREQSVDVRITHSTPFVEDNANSELQEIAGQIYSEDIDKFGTILGFSHVQLDHLKGIYYNKPQRRNYILLKKWCDVVETKYGNHRRWLAKLLSEAEYKNISDDMNEDISDVTIPSELTNDLRGVCFDIPNLNETRYTQPEKEVRSHDYISTETHSNLSRKECMLNMLKDLKLEEFHPSKISLPMINEIIQISTDEKVTKKSIPWLLLRKFMNLNYKGREEELDTLYEYHEDEDVDERSEKNNICLHPLDVFLLTFLCCDPILQQELVSKLFFCRVAVPFIYRTLEDKLIMSKWAFRKIVINRKRGEEWVDDDALSQFVKTVSFIRVGPRPEETISKSKLINEIISKQSHFTFFSQNSCISFETKKLITNGMVEASWFIPSNKTYENEANSFQDVVMFLNLRGDSCKHEEEVTILSSISDVIIVLVDVNILTDSDIIQYLDTIHSFDKSIIYGVMCKKGSTSHKATTVCFRKQLNLKDSKAKIITVGVEISAAHVRMFRREISDLLSKKKAKYFSEVISNIQFGDDNFSVDGYRIAQDIIDFIDKQHVNDKCPLFPLQSDIYRRLCKYRKELFRSNSDAEHIKLMNMKRQAQLEQSDLISKSRVLQQFAYNKLNTCNDKESNKEHLFFIAWMKSLMDKRVRKYQQKNLKFAPCYEHFIREMGQAFLIKNKNFPEKTDGWDVGLFPSFVSNMLKFGFPFELMDGETGMVPLPWVIAVLRQLKKDIGDQNVFIISVLGIQSSGKSTLLNTMFGLHFAVSAGRCTRGVFMQLISVKDDKLPFNYLLILDTEGIRASNSLYDKDRRVFENELATFAIGLGNITILNVKGENTSEIENFLEIAVSACLRLQIVNKNLKMQQRCVFVHQNVDANDARYKLKEERENLMHRLDEMVKDAAINEDRSDVSSFNQVIRIKPESDVLYFPNLWQGEPPMATVTLGYSKQVSRLKLHLLHEIAKSHGTSYSVTDTIIRIEDFCRGILAEDFVFSFRNSLEIKVYRQMEYHFQSQTWKLECEADEFIFTKVRKRIACSERKNIDCVCTKNTEKLIKKLTDKFSMAEETFTDFVNRHKLKIVMEQYKEKKLIEIHQLKTQLIQKGKSNIQLLKSFHLISLDQIDKRTIYSKELKEKAQSYVARCKENELSDKDTDSVFDEIWNNWLKGIDSINDENPLRVEEIIDKILFDTFKAEKPLLNEEIKKMNADRDKYRTMNALKDSVGLNQLQDDHITWELSPGDEQIKDLVFMRYERSALLTINIIMRKIDSYISSLHEEYHPFKDTYARQVFLILMESLDNNNFNTNSSFKLTKALRAKLAVHIKMYIVKVFTVMNDEWQDRNDMKKQMQSEKETFSKYFKSLVKDQKTEGRMAQLFLRNIERFIIETVSHKLPKDVASSIIPGTFSTKYGLMTAIMSKLVTKSNFTEFMQYIDDSSSYALDWLTNYINNKIFTTNEQDNEYTKFAEMHIIDICTNIKKIIIKTSDNKTTRMSEWCTTFENNLNKFYTVTMGTFRTDIGDESVDVCNFQKLTLNELENVKQKVKDSFKLEVAENVKWTKSPYKKVFKRLWGCTAKCPFCNEICQKSDKHIGEAHSCIQHRPPAVIGIRQISTHMMAWMCCNCLVSSDKTFRCNAIDKKFRCQSSGKDGGYCLHQYKKYKKVIPDWTIEPFSLAERPKYWSWFISKFQKELCEKYNYEVYEHQDTWPKITAKDAIESLFLYLEDVKEDD